MNIEDIARIQTTQNTELRHKINELEAHLKAMTDAVNGLDAIAIDMEEGGKIFCQVPKNRFEKVIDLSYQQPIISLARIKVGAFREGFEMSAEGYNAEYGADVEDLMQDYYIGLVGETL